MRNGNKKKYCINPSYSRSGNISKVLIFANFASRTNSRIQDFTMKRYRMNSAIWADTDKSFIVNNSVQSVINVQTLVNYVQSISHSILVSMDKRVDLVKCFFAE